MPMGPWLLVVGMHRSGTSAITGALGRLGFAVPVPGDRYEPSGDNPDHFESRAIGLHDDALLERLSATWDRPPDPARQPVDPSIGTFDGLDDPALPASEAFPNAGPVVWKDPQVCLLLPYWLAHLPKPVAAVFIWRSPLPVAHSLRTRDGLHLADGVALWERYNRSGLAGLVGVDTFIAHYDSIVEDPMGRLGELAGWLADLPQFALHAPHWDLPGAAAAISPHLNRQHVAGDSEVLLDEHRQMVEQLDALQGPHRPFNSPLPEAESPWTTALLRDRHELAPVAIQRDAFKEQSRLQGWEIHGLASQLEGMTAHVGGLKAEIQGRDEQIAALDAALQARRAELACAHEQVERIQASTSWKVTRPLRQLATLRDRKGVAPGD
jgi:hypothetical protein